ncbi:hypothetical protein Efla_006895 [Eimeria flavescens]
MEEEVKRVFDAVPRLGGGRGPRLPSLEPPQKRPDFCSSSSPAASPFAASPLLSRPVSARRAEEAARCCRLVRQAAAAYLPPADAAAGCSLRQKEAGASESAKSTLHAEKERGGSSCLLSSWKLLGGGQTEVTSSPLQRRAGCWSPLSESAVHEETGKRRVFPPLYGHLLSNILALVGDAPQEKSKLAFVCRDWRAALDVHTAWPSVDATHRPLSSLLAHAAQLRRLFYGAEALTPSSSSSTSSSDSSSSMREGEEEGEGRELTEWRLPSLRRLRIHKSLGSGYVTYAAPGALFAAMDSVRLTAASKASYNSGSSKSSSSISSFSRSVSSSNLQFLEELVVECEVGADVLLALKGKTPRLRSLVIAQLAVDASSQETADGSGQTVAAAAGGGLGGGERGEEEAGATSFEALLLLLQSLPPQQLRVFGLRTSLSRGEEAGGSAEGGERRQLLFHPAADSAAAASAAADVKLELQDLRRRLNERRRTGFPQEAQSDELLSLLTEKQNETLCAVWTPHAEPSLVALRDFYRRSRNLRYCSMPGTSVLELCNTPTSLCPFSTPVSLLADGDQHKLLSSSLPSNAERRGTPHPVFSLLISLSVFLSA